MIHKQFIKFTIVGIIASGIHIGTVIFLVELYSMNPVKSSVPAYIAALLTAYILNKTWTFQHKDTLIKAFIPYTLVSTLGLGLNILIMTVLIEQLHIKYFFALAAAVIIVPVVTFTLHKYWTFNPSTRNNNGTL